MSTDNSRLLVKQLGTDESEEIQNKLSSNNVTKIKSSKKPKEK